MEFRKIDGAGEGAADLRGEMWGAEDMAPAPLLTQALKPSISSHNAPYWAL